MSWLTEIAGKAENFLNAMDKGAASALTSAVQKTSGSSRRQSGQSRTELAELLGEHPTDAEYIDTPEIMSLRTSASTNSLLSENGGGGHVKSHTRTSSYDSVGSSKNGSSRMDEDRLMDYLNSKENDIPEEESHDGGQGESDSSSGRNKAEALKQIKELDALNKRFLDLNSDYKKLKLKTIGYYNQCQTSEKMVKELKARESDLNASINVKDSQIAALKVELEQHAIELQDFKCRIEELESLNAQLEEHSKSNSTNESNLISSLHSEITNLKEALEEERMQTRRMVESNQSVVNRLEDNQRSLIEELDSCRRQLAEVKASKSELELANSGMKRKLESLETEYAEFKLKASKTLADKDELIQVLNASKDSTGSVDEEHVRILQEQSDTLVQELTELRVKYDQVRSKLEVNENETLPRMEYELGVLKQELDQEKTTSSGLRLEVSQLSKEAKGFQDDMAQIRSSLGARIAERDEEIEKLRKQLVLKQKSSGTNLLGLPETGNSTPGNSNEEWEQRLRSLTENLISKQSLVEQLSSGNHSLKLQLERAEQRLREMASTPSNQDVAIGIYHSPNFTNLIKHRMNAAGSSDSVPLLEDDPNDGQVTRKVKRAYGAIDAFSIRLGNFLRVYPSARAAFLVYIVVLHLWVAFILIYYEPEIHGPDLHQS